MANWRLTTPCVVVHCGHWVFITEDTVHVGCHDINLRCLQWPHVASWQRLVFNGFQSLVACSVPNHYLNQYWLLNCNFKNRFQRTLNQYWIVSCQSAIENVVRNIVVISSMPRWVIRENPDSKVYGANMRPTWVLSAPDGPHVGPMNLVIREAIQAI